MPPQAYRPCRSDREWLETHLKPLRPRHSPGSVDYLPAYRREDAQLQSVCATRLHSVFARMTSTPWHHNRGSATPIAVFDPREGALKMLPAIATSAACWNTWATASTIFLPSSNLPRTLQGLVGALSRGCHAAADPAAFLASSARLDEQVPVAFFSGCRLKTAAAQCWLSAMLPATQL